MAITLSYSITDIQKDVWQIIYIWKLAIQYGAHLASNPSFLFLILSCSFGEKLERKPGRISHVIWWHRDIKFTRCEGNTSHEMFKLLCIPKGLRERRCNQGDRVTWHVGSLLTKCSYSSWLGILVLKALLKCWNQCMGAMKMPQFLSHI